MNCLAKLVAFTAISAATSAHAITVQPPKPMPLYQSMVMTPSAELPDVEVMVPEATGSVKDALTTLLDKTGINLIIHRLYAKHDAAFTLEQKAGDMAKLAEVLPAIAKTQDFGWTYVGNSKELTVRHYPRYRVQVPPEVVKAGQFTKKLRELGAFNVTAGWLGRVEYRALPSVQEKVSEYLASLAAPTEPAKAAAEGDKKESENTPVAAEPVKETGQAVVSATAAP